MHSVCMYSVYAKGWCVCDMCHGCDLQRRAEEEHVKTAYHEAMEQERREALRKEKEEVTRKKRFRYEPYALHLVCSLIQPHLTDVCVVPCL